jgi:hypothetical protein
MTEQFSVWSTELFKTLALLICNEELHYKRAASYSEYENNLYKICTHIVYFMMSTPLS